ncbi:MAG: 2-C-methyl-D-erythritol 4-phosphate cytidylyltransferase [SAR202 cluster bacterium Io17-Chloro-G3]|nr:MAG: 2-C-methyl-D-erythritol 4-phosphate cytidylyltransferase [SAR202 cluster bacterium Io17-Chloro-G3]
MVTTKGLEIRGRSGLRVGAVIVAAGRSVRMAGLDKLFLPLLSKPVLGHTIDAFQSAPSIQQIVLVLNHSNIHLGESLVSEGHFDKVVSICHGGERRQDSVSHGLNALLNCDWVVVHDGARPCVEAGLIERGLEQALRLGSAVAALSMNDTVKSAGVDFRVTSTINRTGLWAVQTPQVFAWKTLWDAHNCLRCDPEDEFVATDDAALVERSGHPVYLYPGSPSNIKVTTHSDLVVAEAVLRNREER